MSAQKNETKKGTKTEIFFIHNELDEDSAIGIIELLGDIIEIQALSMVQSAERNYSDFIIKQSKQYI